MSLGSRLGLGEKSSVYHWGGEFMGAVSPKRNGPYAIIDMGE